jgi:hypothetical protein
MWELYVYSFIAGVFGANGLPHFVKGSLGQKHQTPFGKNSSAIINVLWGWANFVVAAGFLYHADVHRHLIRAFGMVAIGALLMTLLNASYWSKNSTSNK